MNNVNVAVVGVGNCCSALVQGVHYYQALNHSTGLFRPMIGGYAVSSVKFVAAFDVDSRKVGRPLNEAIFAKPNCTEVFQRDIPELPCIVQMSPVMDGVAAHMNDPEHELSILTSDRPVPSRREVISYLVESKADILVNYLPVGSEETSRFYADCALEAGMGMVNCIPVLIANDAAIEKRFRERGLPLIGDDVKSQLGATVVHRTLAKLFQQRGVPLDRTYQLNVGGNTDFFNMLDRSRLNTKRITKTESVKSMASEELQDKCIHVGPSDYVAWLHDNKTAYIRMEGRLFGDVPVNLEVRLSVEDSPNSAGVVIDMVRIAMIARERGLGGVLEAPSASYCKKPPNQMTDHAATQAVDELLDQLGDGHE